MNCAILTLLATLPGPSPLATAQTEFEAGIELRSNADAARPHFLAAARAFEDAWASEPRTAALARNRARAWFLANERPRAIFALREALELWQWDADLQRELQRCREEVGFPAPKLNQWRNRVSPWDLFIVSSVSSTVYGVGLFLRMAGSRTRANLWMGIGVVGLLIVSALAWQIQREHPVHPFAVLASNTVMRTGNATLYPPRLPSELPAGAEVNVIAERGGWVQVESAEGVRGWVPLTEVMLNGGSMNRR